MSFLKSLFGAGNAKERRKSSRQPSPPLAAYYWTNAAPAVHRIRDISSTGLYLLTEERWYPGTLVMMTLQKKEEGDGTPGKSISVQSKAVRWGDDGVGLQFILMDKKDKPGGNSRQTDGADRKMLDEFLVGFKPENSHACVDRVEAPLKKLS